MHQRNRRRWSALAVPAAVAVLAGVTPLWSWGPHPEIVDAALAALPASDRLSERLGADAGRLRLYVWLGDWKDLVLEIQESWDRGDKQFSQAAFQIYTNDYLIFPLAPRHFQHDVPDITGTYRPFFLRALQALRTETPPNAARWIGSLLHFTTDSGAPPHAAALKGDLHSKMENWIAGAQINIAGYVPRLLGATDEEALRGFEERMNRLIDFSKQRAQRARPLIEADNRPGVEPIVLESANESARVAADLLHTLLFLSAPAAGPALAGLSAEVSASSQPGAEALAARLLLLGTPYSTLSEPVRKGAAGYRGTFHLRALPPGAYTPVVYRTGCKTLFGETFTLKAGSPAVLKWDLEADTPAGDLVRNPDFRIRWSGKDRPEHWQYAENRGGWVSDNVRVAAGRKYRIAIKFASTSPGRVFVQWMQHHAIQLSERIELASAEEVVTPPAGALYVRLIVAGRRDPAETVQRISITGE